MSDMHILRFLEECDREIQSSGMLCHWEHESLHFK